MPLARRRAGVGAYRAPSLTVPLYRRPNFKSAEIEAYEIDNTLRAHLETTLASYAGRLPSPTRFRRATSLEAARKSLQGLRPFSHAILNPPYKKITAAQNTA